MAKHIKNDSGTSKTWMGQEIVAAAYYEIQPAELIGWQNDSALITAIGAGDAVVAKDGSGNNDITDVATGLNYLKDISTPLDTDGVPLSRMKITRTGWHFQAQSIDFNTSTLNGGLNRDSTDTDFGFLAIKYYNSSDVELVAGTQVELDNNCVKTVMTWEATEDFEVLGGLLYQETAPTSDLRIWITAIPDLTPAQGGSVPFVTGGLNLKHMGTGLIFDMDGKSPKLMPYDAVYHTNKFELILRHNVGVKHDLMMLFKLFRENA